MSKIATPLIPSQLYDAGRTFDNKRRITATKPSEPCHVISPHQGRWPFDKVSRATLMAAFTAAGRICAAHYFPSFPLNVQNNAPASEYYTTQWLDPAGESGTYSAQGGYLRQTPPRTSPVPDGTTQVPDEYEDTLLRHELRLIWLLGCNAVAADILGDSGQNYDRCIRVFDILETDYLGDMYGLITPDLTSGYIAGGTKIADLGVVIDTFSDYACAMKDGDNFVIAPYGAEDSDFTDANVTSIINEMTSTHSKAIDWMPIYNNINDHAADLVSELSSEGLLGRLKAIGSWSRGYTSGATDRVTEIATLASGSYGKSLDAFFPVSAQVHRPKNPWYQGAQNLDVLFTYCEGMISGDPLHINIVTWNDYSEGTEFAPSTGTGYVIYDILAYYIQWWGMGEEPTISEDTLYYWYRKQLTTGARSLTANDDLYDGAQSTAFSENAGVFDDKIEIVAFLKEAAVLEIEFNGEIFQKSVAAGLQRFKIDSAVGPAPTFRIRRNNIIAVEMQGHNDIVDKYNIQDLMYYGRGSRQRLLPTAADDSLFISPPWRYGNYSSGSDATLLASEERSPFSNLNDFPALEYVALDQSATTGLGCSFADIDETAGIEITFDFCVTDVNATYGVREIGGIFGSNIVAPVHFLFIDIDAGETEGTFGYSLSGSGDQLVGAIETGTWYRAVMSCTRTDASGECDFYLYEMGTGIEPTLVGSATGIAPRNNQAAAVNGFYMRDSTSRGTILFDNFHVEAL